MSTITVNLGVQVSGGPQISIPAHKIEEVESFQQVELSLKREGGNTDSVTQSATLAKNPVFFAIASDWIDKKEEEKQGWSLKYKIGNGKEIPLNAPHVYLRESTLLLSDQWSGSSQDINPQDIIVTFFKGEKSPGSEGTKEVVAKVKIYVGYDLDDSKQQKPTDSKSTSDASTST